MHFYFFFINTVPLQTNKPLVALKVSFITHDRKCPFSRQLAHLFMQPYRNSLAVTRITALFATNELKLLAKDDLNCIRSMQSNVYFLLLRKQDSYTSEVGRKRETNLRRSDQGLSFKWKVGRFVQTYLLANIFCKAMFCLTKMSSTPFFFSSTSLPFSLCKMAPSAIVNFAQHVFFTTGPRTRSVQNISCTSYRLLLDGLVLLPQALRKELTD